MVLQSLRQLPAAQVTLGAIVCHTCPLEPLLAAALSTEPPSMRQQQLKANIFEQLLALLSDFLVSFVCWSCL